MDSVPLPDESGALVAALFKKEVAAIASGTVEIRALARVPGVRTKVAVSTNDPSVNPVRACVGPDEVSIRRIMEALHGEPVDIVPWSDSPESSIRRALAPLKILRMELVHEEHKARVTVARHPFADAGITTRDLASTLTGWDIELLVDPSAA